MGTTSKARPKHHHIDLPRGFYAMLCSRSGVPEDQWDYMARLIQEAPAMLALLKRFHGHLLSWKVAETAGGEMADVAALLARIDGTDTEQAHGRACDRFSPRMISGALAYPDDKDHCHYCGEHRKHHTEGRE